MLEVHGLKKSFGALQVLRDIDLTVNKGDVVAILGSSGSGKTTLLRCLNFLEVSDEGTMTFDGETFQMAQMRKKDIARLRAKTAFVFQDYNLFLNKTALQNVTEGLVIARKMPRDQAVELRRPCRWPGWFRQTWQGLHPKPGIPAPPQAAGAPPVPEPG